MAVDYELDSSQRHIGTCPNVQSMTQLTISAWICLESKPADAGTILTLSTSDVADAAVLRFIANINPYLHGSVATTGAGAMTTARTLLTLGVRYHVAMRYDDAGDRKVDLFLGGAEDNVPSYRREDAAGGAVLFAGPTGITTIGSRGELVHGFDGTIEELAVWNAVLSDEQIKALFAGGVPVRGLPLVIAPANLQVYCPCDDYASGAVYTTLRDFSVNGYALAHTNSPVAIDTPKAVLGGWPLTAIGVEEAPPPTGHPYYYEHLLRRRVA